MADQTALVRQWILLRTLSGLRQGATVKELARQMGVSEKTIRRDLDTFTEAGFPLRETVERFGRKKWCIEPAESRGQPQIGFTFEEAVALYLGRRFLEPLAGTYFWAAAQSAYRKLRGYLGERSLKHIEKFAPLFHSTSAGASDYTHKGELIDLLYQCGEDRRSAIITYQSLKATEPVTYDVYPYGVTYHRGSLYLVGLSPQHDAIRHWKVDRIERAERGDFPFQRPEGFDLAHHLAGSFGIFGGEGEMDIVVRFSAAVARYVSESSWHASQRLTPQADGSLVAEFCLNGSEELKHWILSFGGEAQVLSPDTFRLDMAEETARMAGLYSADAASDTLGGRAAER